MNRPADGAGAVLRFWFKDEVVPGLCEYRPIWFERVDPAFDAEVRRRFLHTYEGAARGELQHLAATAEGALALAIILDQFPRNMFRGSPRQFEADGMALAIARDALAKGFDGTLPPIRRWFLYLPLQHSESLTDQRRSLALFEALGDDPVHRQVIASARLHLELIERFGRFPHRNAVLGRESTAEEAAFLASFSHRHLGVI